MFRLLISILFTFSFSINVFSQNINKKLDQYLTDYYTNKNVPSISAGLSHDGKIIWLDTRGYSDIENKVPATINTVYRIASISKTITAVAVMQLFDQGKIKLDDDVRKYIQFPAKKWKFTIRQLLSHTAGIRAYKNPAEFDSREFFKSIQDAVNYLAKDSLVYEPGTKYLYTTLGYNLLAAIIENVSGLSYPDYIKKNILEPADMKSTFPDVQRDIIPNRAKGYERNLYRQIQNTALADLSIKIPGGGFLSTSEDLLKFSDSLLKGKLIKLMTLDSMIVPTKLRNGKTINYGLGLEFGIDESGRKYIGHTGGGTGFVSHLLIYPEEKVSAVHLINIRDRNLGGPTFDIAAIYFGREIKEPKKSLADFLFQITLDYGIDSSIASYREIISDTTNSFNKSLEEQITLGYDLINIQRYPDAAVLFRMLTREFPNDAETFIGLGDAYLKDGNKGLAAKNFRLALRLQPLNSYAAEMLKKLNGT
jgi:serine beta-lactamase-like protein LACTB, mitochondrial